MGIKGFKIDIEWVEFIEKDLVLKFIENIKLNLNQHSMYIYLFIIIMIFLIIFLI